MLHDVARLLHDDPLLPSKWNDRMNNRPDVAFDLLMHLGAADQDRTGIISLEG